MKKIEAFIRHEAFEPIRQDLLARGVPSLSVSEVKGSGRQEGVIERYRGAQLTVSVRPKLKIECVVDDSEKELVIEIILKHARTGEIGDGKIFVLPVEESIRVRTGERGEAVLQAHEPSGDVERSPRLPDPDPASDERQESYRAEYLDGGDPVGEQRGLIRRWIGGIRDRGRPVCYLRGHVWQFQGDWDGEFVCGRCGLTETEYGKRVE